MTFLWAPYCCYQHFIMEIAKKYVISLKFWRHACSRSCIFLPAAVTPNLFLILLTQCYEKYGLVRQADGRICKYLVSFSFLSNKKKGMHLRFSWRKKYFIYFQEHFMKNIFLMMEFFSTTKFLKCCCMFYSSQYIFLYFSV